MQNHFSNLSPTSRLLLLGSESEITDYSKDFLKDIEIDKKSEPILISHARRNGLIGLLYKNLKQYSQISPELLEKIRKELLKQTMFQLKQEAVFRELVQIFTEYKIEYRVLKGFYLAREIYKEPGHRPMYDIDVMVKPTEINKVFKLLKAEKFIPYPVAEHEFISNQQHHPFGLKYNGVKVELHRSIFSEYDPVKIKESLLWDDPMIFEFHGIKINTLQKEVFLYHLCHHLMGHLRGDFIKLIWCRDIAEFVSKFEKEIDWNYFLHLCVTSGADEEILHGLWFTHHWMNAEVPSVVLSEVKTEPSFISEQFLWFAENERNKISRPHLRKKFSELKGWNNKMVFLIGKVFPEPKFLLLRYKKRKKISLMMLYPMHMFKVLTRGIKSYL